MKDVFLEARAQLAYARLAASWLDDQVTEHLGHLENASVVVGASSPADVALLESQAEFFRSQMHPALSGAIVLSVYSIMEQALQRLCERHAAYDRAGGRWWARLPGSGMLRATSYLRKVGSPAVSRSGLLREVDDLRLVRNQIAHRGLDFRAAPKGAARAARRHALLRDDGAADTQRILDWMFGLQATLLDVIEAELGAR